MKEKTYQTKIIDYLISQGCYVTKYNASGISKVGVPDLIVCVKGNFLGIEVKKEKGTISHIQQWNINKIRQSGGHSICIKPSDFDEFKSNLYNLEKLERLFKKNEKKDI